MSVKKSVTDSSTSLETQPATKLIPDDHHPDYVPGAISEDVAATSALTPWPDDPLPPFPPFPDPVPRLPFPREPLPRQPTTLPRFCSAVSGRYTYDLARRPVLPGAPVLPANLLSITVRVDVDRFLPQNRISISVFRLFPRATAHVIAEVTSDQCLGFNRRRIAATISYRDGDVSLIPADQVLFEAARGQGFGYGNYTLTLSSAGTMPRSYALAFRSQYFDSIEFEIDRVENAGATVTTYDTVSHPNRPADLASETISLATVYQRAGFDVSMSPSTTVIPTADVGSNGTWSDSEMHNAMVTYWSRFADRPQWAMWVLYAAQHDQGRGLGGVMFDDIGASHRQGTAIFTDSFIQDAPSGEANPAAWKQRMVFWTAVHEMGHAFNLAHAWQKALSLPGGAGNPWIPLANQPESRSFMNYPFKVSGGEASFFSDFRFRFSDDELLFMRHAPRRFVQMGNSNWFVNHGFEAPDELTQTGRWELMIRPNREVNAYSFFEPVVMEFKLTNVTAPGAKVDEHLLADGRHLTVFIQRDAGATKQWRPMITRCHEEHQRSLKLGESIYGSHTISTSTEGWLIDESGFYKVQAAIDMGDEIVVSNVLRLYVAPPATADEVVLAPDYFTENVARALVFDGAPGLAGAMGTLEEVVARCPKNPAALHATQALAMPKLRDYKLLDIGKDRTSLVVRSTKGDIEAATAMQTAVLMRDPTRSADTFGHIRYFGLLDHLGDELIRGGNSQEAGRVMQSAVAMMKKRDVLASVVQAAERKLMSMSRE